MRKLTLIILALGVILSLLSCATSDKKLPKPEGVLLGQSELESLYSEISTFTLKMNTMPAEATMVTFPNGLQTISWSVDPESVSSTDTGTYKIIDGHKYSKWGYITKGEEKCWRFYKISENKYYIECTDGSDYGYVTRK